MISVVTFGQSTEKHPIDVRSEACHDKAENQTTMGMTKCEQIAAEEWDAELNKVYKMLMGILGKGEKEKLKASQLKWIEYRDRELDFSGTLYKNLQGTMWITAAAGRRRELIRERVLALKDYYDTISTDH